ncbi:MAG: CrcB family protein [Actinomycetaceae bacterium]|nr:CrcB family protein [Actinomycetaceae bacterium]
MSDQQSSHRRFRHPLSPELLVFFGGALGALARAILDLLNAGQASGGIAHSTMFVNVVGAFLMGLLVTTWVLRRAQNTVWDRFKLFVGTGFLGAFTTYSTFALAIAQSSKHHVGIAIFTGAGVVLAGIVGVTLGAAVARLFFSGRRIA